MWPAESLDSHHGRRRCGPWTIACSPAARVRPIDPLRAHPAPTSTCRIAAAARAATSARPLTDRLRGSRLSPTASERSAGPWVEPSASFPHEADVIRVHWLAACRAHRTRDLAAMILTVHRDVREDLVDVVLEVVAGAV